MVACNIICKCVEVVKVQRRVKAFVDFFILPRREVKFSKKKKSLIFSDIKVVNLQWGHTS